MSVAERFRHLAEIERRRIVMPDNVRMRLNRLERPEPWPAELVDEIRRTMPIEAVQQYPDYQPFYDRLARFFAIPADEIVVGAGIEEFIRSLFMLCAPDDKVAILWPTCAMFEIYARVFRVDLVRIVTDPARPLTCDALIEQLPEGLRLLLLANPGQPVDSYYCRDDIARIAEACESRGAVLAVDEAYHGFGSGSALRMRRRFDNIVVLRTFSKAFGAASIRLGFAHGSPSLIAMLNAVRQSGEVSSFSMHVASVLLDQFDRFVAPGIANVVAGRELLKEAALSEFELPAWGRWANHVLIELPDAAAVAGRLAARGVLVRAGMPAPLDRHIMVTCGSPELMGDFVGELRAAL